MSTDDLKRYAWPEPEPRRWADTEIKTVLATRLMPEVNAPAQTEQDIGRDVGNFTRELFVSCDATQAMQIQFDHVSPMYLAAHDLGGGLSRQLLDNISKESGWPVQQLVIRRQGYGTTLATVFYIDCPAANDRHVRLYATEVEADAATRAALARLLLARSTMAAVLVPEQTTRQIKASLEHLQAEYFKGEWPNRHMIFMPLKATPEMVDMVAQFGRETGVAARITPSVQRAAQIWVYLGASWNRIQETLLGTQAVTFSSLALTPASLSAAALGSPSGGTPVNPSRFTEGASTPAAGSASPPPSNAGPASTPPAFDGSLDEASAASNDEPPIVVYLRKLCELPGVHSVCVFDVKTLQPLAHAGPHAQPLVMAQQARTVLANMAQAGKLLGLGSAINETVISFANQRMILRGVPGQPGWVLNLVVERNAMSAAQWVAELDKLAGILKPRNGS